MAFEAGLTLPIRPAEPLNEDTFSKALNDFAIKFFNIKTLPKNYFSNVNKFYTSFTDKLSKIFPLMSNDLQSRVKYKNKDKNEDLIAKQGVKYLSFRERLNKTYDKYIIKGKFFEKALTTFTNIARSLKDLAGNWFMKILGFLLLMSIIDPNGEMLKSIFTMLASVVATLMDLIIKALPGLIRIIGNLIFNVFPNIIRRIAEQFEKVLGKDSLLYKFFHDVIPAIFPYLFIGFMVLGAISKFGPQLELLMKVVRGFSLVLWKSFGVLFPMFQQSLIAFFVTIKTALLSFLAIVGPIVGAILAIGLAFYAIYKFSDKIVAFFESIGNKFIELSTSMKIFIGVLFLLAAVFLGPFVLVIPIILAAIYGIAKLFQWIKKVDFSKLGDSITLGLINLWEDIKTSFIDFFKGIPVLFYSFFKNIGILFNNILSSFTKFFDNIPSIILSFFIIIKTSIIKFFDNIPLLFTSFFKNVKKNFIKFTKEFGPNFFKFINWIKNGISNFASGLWNLIKKGFLKIIDWFKELPNAILNKLKSAGTFIIDIGKSIFETITSPIKKVVRKLVDFVAQFYDEYIGSTFSAIKDSINNLLGYFTAISALDFMDLFDPSKVKGTQTLDKYIKTKFKGSESISTIAPILKGTETGTPKQQEFVKELRDLMRNQNASWKEVIDYMKTNLGQKTVETKITEVKNKMPGKKIKR